MFREFCTACRQRAVTLWRVGRRPSWEARPNSTMATPAMLLVVETPHSFRYVKIEIIRDIQ